MKFVFVAATLILSVGQAQAQIDFKNVRPLDGPNGAVRKHNNVMPGDTLVISYEIVGLAVLVVDPKTEKISYQTTLQIIDAEGKILLQTKTPVEAIPNAKAIPAELEVTFGIKSQPGKYSIRLTVHDNVGMAARRFEYRVNLLEPKK
jgi:hypothetical protein